MAAGKAPGPNVFESNMSRLSIPKCHFSPGVTKGVFPILHKSGDQKELRYWRLVALLKTSYNSFVKALHSSVLFLSGVGHISLLRMLLLQSVLMDEQPSTF